MEALRARLKLLDDMVNSLDIAQMCVDPPGSVQSVAHTVLHKYHIKLTNLSNVRVTACVTQSVVKVNEISKAIKLGASATGGSIDISESLKQAFKDRVSCFPLHPGQVALKVPTSSGELCYLTVILEDGDEFKYVCDNVAVANDYEVTIEQRDIDDVGSWITVHHEEVDAADKAAVEAKHEAKTAP